MQTVCGLVLLTRAVIVVAGLEGGSGWSGVVGVTVSWWHSEEFFIVCTSHMLH